MDFTPRCIHFNDISNFMIHEGSTYGRFVRYLAIAWVSFIGTNDMIGFRGAAFFLNRNVVPYTHKFPIHIFFDYYDIP